MKALAQWVAGGVQQGADALLLVVVQHHPAHPVRTQCRFVPDQQRDTDAGQQHRGQDQLPAEAGEEDHRQPGGHHQQGGAQVGLLHDQAHWQQQQDPGHQEVQRPQLALAALEPPGQHQRGGDLEDFTGLDDHPQVDPAFGTFLGNAEQRHRNQQGYTHGVQRHGEFHQALGWHLGHHKHDAAGNQHVAGMVHEAGAMVKPGGIHGHQPGTDQQKDSKGQPAIEALHQRQEALGPGGFLENGRHKNRLSRAASATARDIQ